MWQILKPIFWAVIFAFVAAFAAPDNDYTGAIGGVIWIVLMAIGYGIDREIAKEE